MKIILIVLAWLLIGAYSFCKIEKDFLKRKEITVGMIFECFAVSCMGVFSFLLYIFLKLEDSKFWKKVIWKKK